MDSSRRRILQLLGVSALALTTKPVFNAFAKEAVAAEAEAVIKAGAKSLKAKQWAMVIDTRKLHSSADLEPIVEACHKVHNVPTAIVNKNHENIILYQKSLRQLDELFGALQQMAFSDKL